MSIQIMICAFNRKRITELSLYSVYKYKGRGGDDNKVVVYNDHSSEYDNAFLEQYSDEVIKLPNKLGIDLLRLHQLEEFLQSRHDYIYLTDNDAIHDPDYINRLLDLYTNNGIDKVDRYPVCLYNAQIDARPDNIILETEDVSVRKTAPGISMFLDKRMVETILKSFYGFSQVPNHDWDYLAIQCLGLPCIVSKTSYVEHFGASGLHNPRGLEGMNRDRAYTPTSYLKKIREAVIEYVLFDGESPIHIL